MSTGVHFDSFLTTEKQANSLYKACYHQICNIGSINPTECLQNVSIALLCGLPGTPVTRSRKRNHLSRLELPALASKIIYKLQYNVLVYAYKTLNGTD